jgi:acetyl/propionyl-CoA carboxylase alpha subunit
MSGRLPFRSVLVANRGEIAARILRTVRAMGLQSLLVRHPVDAGSPASQLADEFAEISGPTPAAAYLDIEQIVAAARRLGAEAVHPGYGFLSENAGFARAVAGAGMIFVGPSPEAIELMGDKVRARNFAALHGIPVAPSASEDDGPEDFVGRARALGAPLLIKPAGGGGGKGMRIVRDVGLLEEEIERARREGQRYFGDGRLYVERYLERPRHIEVQILGDAFGRVIHLFERECSLQRRFQKIVEESPSPGLDAKSRARICEMAVKLARAAGYANAGTVEFIQSGDEVYFLEMNTRLQVEHPVTELVTGLDLVEQQLRIAGGLPLDFEQDDVRLEGHAIELRINAEDPATDFSPTTGPVLLFRPPSGVRTDAGVAEGGVVTSAFDSLLAKIIVQGPERADALALARQALSEFVLLGCRTNAAFLTRLLDDPDVKAGDLHTGLVADKPELASVSLDPATRRRLLAGAALATRSVRLAAEATPGLYARIGHWRN